ncbi:hypothetical protein C8Q74DRAFT_1365271 [Fomes fomentarius]|nr:hypothetical protein C8Q74DRAFT_1365271 [Fomes fomentarius]
MGLLQSLLQLEHLKVICAVSDADPPQVAMDSETWRIRVERLLTFLSSHPARLHAGLTQLTTKFQALRLPDDRGRTHEVTRGGFLGNVYDEKWWRAELTTRLKAHLHAAIDVTLRDGQDWDLLWCTEAEVDKALALNSEEDFV